MYIITQIILALLVAMFALYVAIELRALRRGKAVPDLPATHPSSSFSAIQTFEPPFVSVLLPIYNEKLVVEKLISAVCALDYPLDKLEILVLDDSTDHTSQVARAAIGKHASRGFPIRLLRRQTRIGYKAGNLNFGLSHARGEFIAIFDADCLPPPDFLLKVMPAFNDRRVGFLQTKIIFANADDTFLTRFQAMEASHKEDVTSGFAADGFMASLTGSSCVWRRACIDAIGGISQDTITEDVDMGYAAQLKSWTYVFPTNVVSWAELPESMAAFRVQRQRWARGLAHNAFRHARDLFKAPMKPLARIHAITLVFSPLLLALFYALLLLSPFIALSTANLGWFFNICCSVFLLGAVVWGWINTSSSLEQSAKKTLFFKIRQAFGYVLIFFPLSLYYFSAIIQTAFRGRGNFYTTPKGCGRRKVAHPPINNILLGLEIFSFLYALASFCVSMGENNYWAALYTGLALGGFSMTLFFSYSDSRKKIPPPGHVLITGASGAIGSALAFEYASPGVQLTLQGRNRDALEQIAEKCVARGALVTIKILDLRHTENVHAWSMEIASSGVPDLIVANAGVNTNTGADWEGEPYTDIIDCVRINLLSTMALVNGVLPAMRARKMGQIAIVSSLAAYYGLAATPAYCATKGALKNWGTSLRGWLGSEGVHVSVIFPGYVKSPMCDAMPGPRPFLRKPEYAARIIKKGLERDKARISFPFPLNLGVWALGALPVCLAMPIARMLGYGR